MRADLLQRLLGIRLEAVDQARRALAASIADEGLAARDLRTARLQVANEAAAALDPAAPDGAVENYVGWLPRGRLAIALATRRQEATMQAVNAARASLAAATAERKAIETLLERLRAEEAVVSFRRDTAALDEIASRVRASE